MTWDRSAPANPKYQTREHRDYLASLKRELSLVGVLMCCEDVCLFPTRAITNPNGNEPDGLTAAHNPDGVTYRGAAHRRCNLTEAAKRARSRQGRRAPASRRWVL